MTRLNHQRGATMVITAAALIGLLVVAALAIDIANAYQLRRHAQATADAAALAAVQDLPDIAAAVAAAQEYAARNMPISGSDWAACSDPAPLAVVLAPCISANPAMDHVRVRLPVQTASAFFGKVSGRDSYAVGAAATAEIDFTTADQGPGAGTPGDGDPTTPDLRSGDPGGGYPPCANIPDWNAPAPPGGKKNKGQKWSEFIFVFEHTDGTVTTVCGTSRSQGTGNNAFVPDAGGTSIAIPRGIWMHVSCSDIFTNGWTDPGRFDSTFGPHQDLDPEWRVIRYTIDKYKVDKKTGQLAATRCGETFPNITSTPPPPPHPSIRLTD